MRSSSRRDCGTTGGPNAATVSGPEQAAVAGRGMQVGQQQIAAKLPIIVV